MKLTSFDRESLNAIRNDVTSALKTVEERYGVTFNLGRITYGSDNLRAKLTGALTSAVGTDNSMEAQLIIGLKEYGHRYGLSIKDAKKVFSASGKQFVFMGIKPSSKKYPLIVKRIEDGKMYKYPVYFKEQIKASKEFAQ